MLAVLKLGFLMHAWVDAVMLEAMSTDAAHTG